MDEYEKRQLDDDCEQDENVAMLGEDYSPIGGEGEPDNLEEEIEENTED